MNPSIKLLLQALLVHLLNVARMQLLSQLSGPADFFYTNDAPDWTHIGSAEPNGDAVQTINITYTLPMRSTTQAVRDQFCHLVSVGASTSTDPCDQSSEYNDRDDVVFTVV